jgi:hypothetical protein
VHKAHVDKVIQKKQCSSETWYPHYTRFDSTSLAGNVFDKEGGV